MSGAQGPTVKRYGFYISGPTDLMNRGRHEMTVLEFSVFPEAKAAFSKDAHKTTPAFDSRIP